MSVAIDPVALAAELVRCPSVTPHEGGALDLLERVLRTHGFACHRLTFGEAPDGPVQNLFARIGEGGPHFAFAGHSDVVPPGDAAAWSVSPFAGAVTDGWLLGRGSADMKGAIAAFIAAATRQRARSNRGSISLIITGDEEGPATFGTAPMLDWMHGRGQIPDHCLVGEPTSARVLGDTIKIGRRGSLNAWITVPGAQGHVAYPHLADNPVTRLVHILASLKDRALDGGSDWFEPSNLEITDVTVGNPATNIIPALASARLNIRFNNLHRGADLADWIAQVVRAHAPAAEIVTRISGESFLTEPCGFTALVSEAVRDETGAEPQLSTGGGTSDARFITRYCPVLELGLVGTTMHKVDEAVPVADIHALARIYGGILARYFDEPRGH